MAIQVSGTTVIDDSRVLQNVTGLKTINSNSILGSGDLTISGSDVAANGYAFSTTNQYGVKTSSPGFNKGIWFASAGSTRAGYFNSGSYTAGVNSSGYTLGTIAVRIP